MTLTAAVCALALVGASALLCATLILLVRPLLARHLLAIPNARSSHRVATPQGAGVAVVAAVLIVWTGLWLTGLIPQDSVWALLVAAAGLALMGLADDAQALPISWRLLGQALAALVMLASVPETLRVLPAAVPLWLERGLLLFIVVGFVNAINFLDGIDLMTVAQVVPMTGGIALLHLLGAVSSEVAIMSLVLLGAILGFAIFNTHPARLFLGDAGSLPIGLLLAWLLIKVASVNLAAALLLPLYTLADATITFCRRAAAGEKVLQAHRSHFYQRALDAGYCVPEVTLRVFVLGLLLASLAIGAAIVRSPLVSTVFVALGAGATAYLLSALAKGKS